MKHRRFVIGLVVLVLAAGALATWYAIRPPRHGDGLLYDPIEDDPKVRPLFAEANVEATRQLEEWRAKQGRPGKPQFGDVRYYWNAKKQFLKDKYGIDWRTPAEMNPNIAFD
jgi:hypothetical protein